MQRMWWPVPKLPQLQLQSQPPPPLQYVVQSHARLYLLIGEFGIVPAAVP